MAALRGVGVLVTRPEQQATPLCRLLEASGATVVRLPAIEISPSGDFDELETRLGAQKAFDLVIFTSANAVRFGAPLLRSQRESTLAAIGPATARALAREGFHATVTPAAGFDSEGLLLHPRLAHPAGQRVLIVTGLHGRELLQEELGRRGAQVVIAGVYKRERAVHDPAAVAALEARLAAGDIQVITATSAEIAASLLATATRALRREFDRVHWLVPGARVAHMLLEHGVRGPILQADTAEDQDLVAAIVRWRADESGA
jgi:uroporphyrinogen-III synthase